MKIEADGWRFVLARALDGLDMYRSDNGYIAPQAGAHFLWFDIRLTNVASVGRWFDYDRCDLDAGDERILPGIVQMDPEDGAEAPDFEALAPGQEIQRTLVFAYPDDSLPTRLACGNLSIPLRRMKPAKRR